MQSPLEQTITNETKDEKSAQPDRLKAKAIAVLRDVVANQKRIEAAPDADCEEAWQPIWRALSAAERSHDEAVRLLRDICNPIEKLRRDAEAQGLQLSGMAYQIANNISTVQRWARAFLDRIGEQ